MKKETLELIKYALERSEFARLVDGDFTCPCCGMAEFELHFETCHIKLALEAVQEEISWAFVKSS